MNVCALVDNKIKDDELKEVIRQVKEIYKKKANLSVGVDVYREDMSDLPFEEYRKDDPGISKSYIRSRAKAIKKRYARRYSHILFWVSHENFYPQEKGIWGWAIPSIQGYEIIQCRFDTHRKDRERRINNSVGTLWHELAHTHDSFISRIIGKTVEKMLSITKGMYDAICVHGESNDWEYIRHKENTRMLDDIGKSLRAASNKRQRQHQTHISTLKRLIEAYRSLIVALQKGDIKN